jgi:hypothetical protein
MNRQERRRQERNDRKRSLRDEQRQREDDPLTRFRMETGGFVTPGDITQFVREVPDRLDEFDRPGRHLWTVTSMYYVADPEDAVHGADPFHMDRENLILVAGVGCFKCEALYSATINLETCKGSISND